MTTTYLPISKSEDDLFEYTQFADNLAQSINSIEKPIGYVVSLMGPWGSGKSSLINLVEKSLESYSLRVVKFNPWMYSSKEAILEGLFDEITSVFKKDHKKIKAAWNNFRSAFSQAANISGSLNAVVPGSGSVLQASAEFIKKQESLSDTKVKLASILNDSNKKVIVIIDDIDRLSNEEIVLLFSSIKALLDLPYIVYITAFDRKVVEEALSVANTISGADYLEKIVQASFNLPYPSEHMLGHLMISKLTNLFGSDLAKETFILKTRFWNVYHAGLSKYFRTPRNVLRTASMFELTYAGSRDEINPIDFFAMETLRLFESSLYEFIRRNPTLFTGHLNPLFYKDFSNSLIEELIKLCPELKRVELSDNKFVGKIEPGPFLVLTQLFPKMQSLLKNDFFSSKTSEERNLIEKRVCAPENFWSYFNISEKTRIFPNSELEATLQSCLKSSENCDRVMTALSKKHNVHGNTRAISFLERLFLEPDKLSTKLVHNLILSIAKLGDSLWAQDLELALLDQRVISKNDEMTTARLKYYLKRSHEPGALFLFLVKKTESDKRMEYFKLLTGNFRNCLNMIASVVTNLNKDREQAPFTQKQIKK